jgi:hypothetical protein
MNKERRVTLRIEEDTPENLQRLLNKPARERARMAINYRECQNYNLPPELTPEQFQAIEDSLDNSRKEKRAYRIAQDMQSESKEVTLMALYNCNKTLLHLEELKRAHDKRGGSELIQELRLRVIRMEDKIRLDYTSINEETEKAIKGILKALDSAESRGYRTPPADIEQTETELRDTYELFLALTKGGRLLMKHYRIPIKPHILHYQQMEELLTHEVTKANKAGITSLQPDIEAPEDIVSSIVESRINYIGEA